MLEKFARYPLTFGPSYIHPLERLSAYLGNVVRLYAKREDCNSGLAFGGNKLRKLEFIVPDATASGADTLVSIGGVQSNHTRREVEHRLLALRDIGLSVIDLGGGPIGADRARRLAELRGGATIVRETRVSAFQ
jgi:1-aminocyclopropane-1-carboxylate deaminase/D-cysteine desulfhydrase-like pyridoxal-dependent ACC family enzyme